MTENDDVMVVNPHLPAYQMTGVVVRTGDRLALVRMERSAFDQYLTWIAMTDLEVI